MARRRRDPPSATRRGRGRLLLRQGGPRLDASPGRRGSPFAAALVAVVAEHDRGHAPAELLAAARADAYELGRRAAFHRILSFLFVDLRTAEGVDPEVLAELERHYTAEGAKHLRALAELGTFGEAMRGAGIPWLTFKGAVLSELVYDRPDLRTYGDVDVLVAPAAYADAIRALERAGYELLDRNWELIRREGRGQLHVRMPLGTVADVHWHVLNRAAVRSALCLDPDDLFEASRTVERGGVALPTFGAVDTLVHLCLHAALSGGNRLLWLKDVERAIVAERPDWGEVVERARSWSAGALVATTLMRAARSAAAAVPARAVRALLPSRARRAVSRAIDAAWPTERSTGRVDPAVVWSQAARESGRRTAAALGVRLVRPLGTVRGPDGDVDEGPGVYRTTGDEATRDAFLADIARRLPSGRRRR